MKTCARPEGSLQDLTRSASLVQRCRVQRSKITMEASAAVPCIPKPCRCA